MKLHPAAKEGDIRLLKSEIKRIFNELYDTNSRQHALGRKDIYQLTPLLYAVKYGNFEAVKLLLEKGAYVNGTGKDGCTPLHYATRFSTNQGDCSIIQFLIYSNGDINAADEFGLTPLHYACSRGNVRAVEELLRSKNINVMTRDNLDATPLHAACSYGSIELVDILKDNGANVFTENNAKMTPFHVACAQGQKDLVEHLLENVEEEAGRMTVQKLINQQTVEGQSLLHLAVLGSYMEIVKFLLYRGADVNQCMDGSETCLHIAAVTGHKEILKLLINYGINIDMKNDDGRTALHKAARFGKYEVVEILLNEGADINNLDNESLTPLILAASASSNAETVQVLLDHDADINVLDKEDRTALHMAAKEDNIKVVKALLASKAAQRVIDLWDKESNTSLHIACTHGYEEVAILLMDAKADVQKRNNDEKTPLHLASYFGQNDVVDNIIAIKPSTINDFDQKGNSALHLAAMNGHFDVITYLLKCGALVNDKNIESMTALDCAAENGMTEAAKVLLWGGACVVAYSDTGFNPLHRACKEGHDETAKLLLGYCDISVTDGHGRNALDLAIEYNHKHVVEELLNHRDWKVALRNKTLQDGIVVTPLRKMIIQMPEMAIYTFDQCISECGELSDEHENYFITVTYEFIDDTYSEWPCDVVRRDTKAGKGKGDRFTLKEIQEQMERKESHPLYYMIHHRRKDLVMHPLVCSLVEQKWAQFASYVDYFKMFLYTLFLFFLTGFILSSASAYDRTLCRIVLENDSTFDQTLFIVVGRYVLLFLAVVNIIVEMVLLVTLRLKNFEWANMLHITTYILAIVSVIDDFFVLSYLKSNNISCDRYQKGVNAVSIFLGWVNFILFIRKVPVFGIYIVMFLYVIRTFLKFFVVFFFLIMAFAFAFFVLLHDEDGVSYFTFHAPTLPPTSS